MLNNTIGAQNTAVGTSALAANTTGANNTAVGHGAGPSIDGLTNTTCIGYNAAASGSNSIILGNGTARVGINNTAPRASIEVTGNIYSSNTVTTSNVNLLSSTLGTATAGEIQYNSYLYSTINTTNGRGIVPVQNIYRLATNGSLFSALGTYFFSSAATPSGTAINLAASSVYEVEIVAYFLKTTAGNVTWTLIASSAPTLISAHLFYTNNGVSSGNSQIQYVGSQGATTAAFGPTNSLTAGANSCHTISAKVITNLATTFSLQAYPSAGSMTPLAGSYYRVTAISPTTGSFT